MNISNGYCRQFDRSGSQSPRLIVMIERQRLYVGPTRTRK